MECEFRDKSVLPCRYYIKDQYCSLDNFFLCIEARKRKAPRISHSELSTYGKCYRMWWLSYMVGLERVNPPIRLLAGKIFSECLDQLLSNNPQSTYQQVIQKYSSYKDEKGEFPRELLMITAWMEALEQLPISEEKGEVQYEFTWSDLDYPRIHGFLDFVRMDADDKPSYAKEFKYSSNPEGWNKFTLCNQLGTYFLGVEIPRIEAVIFKVPQLKMKKGKNEESGEEFKDRVKKEILLNKLEYITKQNYYRNEFNLEEVKRRYQVMTKELYDRLQVGESAFWMTDNRETCFRCDFLEICSNDGIVSEQLYVKKQRKGEGK
jgi:hypothetical protein